MLLEQSLRMIKSGYITSIHIAVENGIGFNYTMNVLDKLLSKEYCQVHTRVRRKITH